MRVIALIVLLFAAGAATRGYLPGAVPGPRRAAAAERVEPIVLAALLAVSSAVIIFATVHRNRHSRADAGSVGELSVMGGIGRARPVWWVVLIVLAALGLWLLGVLVLAKLGGGQHFTIPGELLESGESAPPAPGAPTPARPLNPGGSIGEVPGYLLAVSSMLIVLLAAVVIAARTRHRAPGSPAIAAVPAAGPVSSASQTLVRAAELGLTRIADRSRGPREAIIACYVAMEHELGAVPDIAPRDFDTPTEVLARAVEHHALPADNASRLVELFTEARFSAHRMTEQHRADAVQALQLVLDELRCAR